MILVFVKDRRGSGRCRPDGDPYNDFQRRWPRRTEDQRSFAELRFRVLCAVCATPHNHGAVFGQPQHGSLTTQEQHASRLGCEVIALIHHRSRRNRSAVDVHPISFHHDAQHCRPCRGGTPRKDVAISMAREWRAIGPYLTG